MNSCMKALTIMPHLILQTTNIKTKAAEIKNHIERRLNIWKQGKINELHHEGKAIQSRLTANHSKPKNA